jgi:hypothetical protein
LLYCPGFEILVREFTNLDLARILISLPKLNQIKNQNKPKVLEYIEKKCPMLGTN